MKYNEEKWTEWQDACAFLSEIDERDWHCASTLYDSSALAAMMALGPFTLAICADEIMADAELDRPVNHDCGWVEADYIAARNQFIEAMDD